MHNSFFDVSRPFLLSLVVVLPFNYCDAAALCKHHIVLYPTIQKVSKEVRQKDDIKTHLARTTPCIITARQKTTRN